MSANGRRTAPPPDGAPASQRPRVSDSAAFVAAAQGQGLVARSHVAVLSHIDESSSASPAPAPVAGAAQSPVNYSFVYEGGAGNWTCKFCKSRVVSHGDGNLGKHLMRCCRSAWDIFQGGEPNKRGVLTDLLTAADADRRRQGAIEKYTKRVAKTPSVHTTEARWVLWITAAGISYNAISHPLFRWARKVFCFFPYPSDLSLRATTGMP